MCVSRNTGDSRTHCRQRGDRLRRNVYKLGQARNTEILREYVGITGQDRIRIVEIAPGRDGTGKGKIYFDGTG